MGAWQDWLGASPWIVLGVWAVVAIVWNTLHGQPWHGVRRRRRETPAESRARTSAACEQHKARYRAQGRKIPGWWP